MSRRTSKVEELLREEMARLIQTELPEKFGIITVTRTMVAPDLRTAKVFITAILDNYEKDILIELKNKTNNFQKVVGKKLELRNTPKLSFEFDRARHEIDRVEELLEEINRGT